MARRASFVGSIAAPILDESVAAPSIDQPGGGPANRALSELALMFGDEQSFADTDRWELGMTLRFVAMSCGFFWLAAAAVVVALR
ncbi:MAG: hypothetical protein WDN01_14755 [Rhizomicrobium sp.]